MIQEFVEIWEKHKHSIENEFRKEHPNHYTDIIKLVVKMLHDNTEKWYKPDPEHIHTIDDGDYQGTLVYVIPETGYQPSTYWYVMVGYGSCSGCDTLQAICDYSDEKPNDKQVKEYMTLALHIIQGIKKMGDE